MATPKASRAQRLLLESGNAVHRYSNFQSIVLQLRHDVPTEVALAATSFKGAVTRCPGGLPISSGALPAVVAVAGERPV
jgi:hypothetical protein